MVTINVSKETWEKLKELKYNPGDTFNDAIDVLLGKLETAKEVIGIYRKAEEERLSEEKAILVGRLAVLREKLELPEKDYSHASLDVIVDALETCTSLIAKTPDKSPEE